MPVACWYAGAGSSIVPLPASAAHLTLDAARLLMINLHVLISEGAGTSRMIGEIALDIAIHVLANARRLRRTCVSPVSANNGLKVRVSCSTHLRRHVCVARDPRQLDRRAEGGEHH
ncbi:hypothetical protein BRPE64_ECDS00050 (plasmid) [Caballeronia insecticola]|uniref:Uncharacterized protein n=1 Tax=Caballeronia insecticola TaxID=758793 RepID=R4WU95_9BURK|nr:hypothetical protein BRPE64_ECDS00050 [Caballeronia insecticola]